MRAGNMYVSDGSCCGARSSSNVALKREREREHHERRGDGKQYKATARPARPALLRGALWRSNGSRAAPPCHVGKVWICSRARWLSPLVICTFLIRGRCSGNRAHLIYNLIFARSRTQKCAKLVLGQRDRPNARNGKNGDMRLLNTRVATGMFLWNYRNVRGDCRNVPWNYRNVRGGDDDEPNIQ